MEVSVRYQIFPLFLVMTSLWCHLLLLSFQIYIFVEHDISYQPCKFQLSRMSGSSLKEGGGKHPLPQCCTGRKNPSAFRVKHE